MFVNVGSGNPMFVNVGSGNPMFVNAGSGNPMFVNAGSGNPTPTSLPELVRAFLRNVDKNRHFTGRFVLYKTPTQMIGGF